MNQRCQFPIRRITPAYTESHPKHYFYAYYDNYAYNKNQDKHLVNCVDFMDRLPTPEDVNQLCEVDLKSGDVRVLGETNTWNFQQGSMLEWNPLAPNDEIVYNCFYDGDYRCAVKNIHTGQIRYMEKAVADLSPDGRYGLAVNFNRIYDFRPGYGYCQYRDSFYDVPAPAEDGVFLVDMTTGKSRQIINYQTLKALYNVDESIRDHKIVINHITFNPTSNRFLFLVRYFPQNGGGWKTGLGTSDLEGNIYLLRPYTYASHYHWRDEQTILIHANCGAEGDALYELTDLTQDYKVYDQSFFTKDIHCSYSPNRKYIIGDGYPQKDQFREIFLYNRENGKGILLGEFYSPIPNNIMDIRCDLHIRWNPDGQSISFDSNHEGYRGIYIIELEEAFRLLEE